ncbi:MAG: cyclic nucleotide-binding domain-containing protein [Acidobacteria bacterium]|nr:cyclic nucleotide-binding domain-containing protein [Acidobacteriota bacterium]
MANPFKDYIVKLRAGDLVFKEGDPGTEMYIVQSGKVEVFSDSPRGRVTLSVMEKGDFFGEMALLDGAPHGASARAIDDVELIEINSTLFDRMIKGNVEIAVRMLRKLSIRLRETDRKYEALLGAPAAASAAPAAAREPITRTAPPPAVPPASSPLDSAPTRNAAFAGTHAEEAAPPEPPAAAGPAPHRPAAPPPGVDGCHAFLLSEDGKENFPIAATKAVMGRFDPVTGLKPEVDLSNVDINRSVSRRHARLNLEGGIYYLIEEPGALNGTFINGRKLITGKPTRVKDGDAVSLGTVKLVFHETGKA